MTNKKALFLLISVGLMMTLLAAALFGQAVQKDNVYRYLSVFTEVLSIVNSNYVEEVPSGQLINGAFRGVTQAVDEFSYYIPPADMAAYKKQSGETGFIDAGALVTKRFGYAYAISVTPGSPADKAGLGPGDFIDKIDGIPTSSLAVWQVEDALRGKKGDAHKLVVVHGGMTKREEMTVTLDTTDVAPVEQREYGTVEYVKVPDFNPGTAQKFEAALTKARTSGKKAVIVDLRENAAGSYDEAIRSADMLLSKGMITSIVGRRVEKKSWQADRATSFDGDVVVLTDPSAAGPSEVFAAAIGGNQRGRVVGIQTYGRAIVQKLVELPSGGGLYITIGHYSTPEAKPIKETGVKPDIIVDRFTFEGADQPTDRSKKPDLILEKALSLFKEDVKKAAA